MATITVCDLCESRMDGRVIRIEVAPTMAPNALRTTGEVCSSICATTWVERVLAAATYVKADQ